MFESNTNYYSEINHSFQPFEDRFAPPKISKEARALARYMEFFNVRDFDNTDCAIELFCEDLHPLLQDHQEYLWKLLRDFYDSAECGRPEIIPRITIKRTYDYVVFPDEFLFACTSAKRTSNAKRNKRGRIEKQLDQYKVRLAKLEKRKSTLLPKMKKHEWNAKRPYIWVAKQKPKISVYENKKEKRVSWEDIMLNFENNENVIFRKYKTYRKNRKYKTAQTMLMNTKNKYNDLEKRKQLIRKQYNELSNKI